MIKLLSHEVPPLVQLMFDFHEEPGWVGTFTRKDAEGAPLKAGQRVVKVAVDRQSKGAETPIGTKGTVLGSMGPMPPEGVSEMVALGAPATVYLYFIEWDDKPKVAIACGDWKVKAI